MKKVVMVLALIICIFIPISINTTSNAVNEVLDSKQVIETNTSSELADLKSKTESEIDDYTKKYGSKTYGMAAYVLNKIRIFSIPFCFVGIAIGAIYQYVIGIRKLDVRDKGFGLVIAFITILVICQVLPLIFAIVVNGWRG